MNDSIKYVTILLVILTIVFGGYYVYVQRSATSLSDTPDQKMVQDMLAHTQVFIERSQELSRISLDLSIFEDERFRALKSFTGPVKDQATGRPDPFAPAESSLFNQSP